MPVSSCDSKSLEFYIHLLVKVNLHQIVLLVENETMDKTVVENNRHQLIRIKNAKH